MSLGNRAQTRPPVSASVHIRHGDAERRVLAPRDHGPATGGSRDRVHGHDEVVAAQDPPSVAEGHARGRFEVGPDDTTLDQVTGLIMMTIRRLADGPADTEAPRRAVERGLRALGVEPAEAAALAAEAAAAAGDQSASSSG